MKAYFVPERRPDASLGHIMQIPPDQLCEMGWPLLTLPEQWRPLTDLYFPPPMRVSTSTKASEATFLQNISSSAQHLMDQLEGHNFSVDEPMSVCYRMRAALFTKALKRLHASSDSILPPSVTYGWQVDTPSRIQPACNAAAERTPSPTEEMDCDWTPLKETVFSKKNSDTNCIVPHPGGAASYGVNNDEEGQVASSGSDSVHKPDATLYTLYGGSESEVDNLVRTTSCPSRLLLAAAVIALNARADPCAGAAYVRLLRATISAEAQLKRKGKSKVSAADSEAHRSLVQHVLLPLLHFIPLVQWEPSEMLALAEVLSTAEAPQLRSGFHQSEHCCNVSFRTTTLFRAANTRDGDCLTDEQMATNRAVEEEADAGSSFHPHADTSSTSDFSSIPGSDSNHSSEQHSDEDEESISSSITTVSEERIQTISNESAINSYESLVSGAQEPSSTNSSFPLPPCSVARPSSATTSIHRVPKTDRVSIHIHQARRCENVRILVLPLHPSTQERDVVAECHCPEAGDVYKLSGPAEIQILCYNKNADEGEEEAEQPSCGSSTSIGSNASTLAGAVASTITLTADTRSDVEWALALVHAQRYIAEQLLADIQPKGHDDAGSQLSVDIPPALFKNGLREGSGKKSVEEEGPSQHPFVESIANLPAQELRLRTRCRQGDVDGVRAALIIIAHCLTWNNCENNDGEEVHWKSRVWVDALRRVSLASSSLDKQSHFLGDIVQFLIEEVEGCAASPADIIDATINLLTKTQVSVMQTRRLLQQRRVKAHKAMWLLTLLIRSVGHVAPKELALTVKSFKTFLMMNSDHYLSAFTGCGAGLEEMLRKQVHALLNSVFTLLRGVVSRAAKRQTSPHRFLFHAWDYGAFTTLSLSLLASRFDRIDIAFVCEGIAEQVSAMLPDFTALSRTDSFLVGEDEEFSIAKVLVEYFCEGVSEEDDRGVVMVGALQEAGHTFFAKEGSAFAYSEDAIFCCESTGLQGDSKTFNLHLLSGDLECFYVGLATQALSFAQPDIKADEVGIYYLASGSLHHGGSTSPLPPLRSGDVVSITFSFEVKQWRIGLVLNGWLVASFLAPRHPLHLVLGFSDGTSRNVIYRGVFGKPLYVPDQQQDQPLSLYQLPQPSKSTLDLSSPSNIQRLRLEGRGPHMKLTFYNASLYTALVFHYLILSCTKKVRLANYSSKSNFARRIITPSTSPVPVQDDTMSGFVDSSCAPLQQNIKALVRAISALPNELATEDATERVKRRAALLVYNNLLLDYVITLSVALRCASAPVGVLDSFTEVICCKRVTERTRSVALSAAYNAICMPTSGFGLFAFNPEKLWQCCCELAQDSDRPSRPYFSLQSIASDVFLRSGGRSIAYKPGGLQRSTQRSVSYASEGFFMNGSSGDEFSFSVRLQRGFMTDTLGRFYHVGVASCRGRELEKCLSSHPGERSRQLAVFSLTDFFSDAPERCKTELRRYKANWLSGDESVVFGSGDVISVCVSAKRRTVSFERNGLPLGVLYGPKELSSDSVKVLFPFVELYNRDSMAKWMQAPFDLLTNSRYTLRAMMKLWKKELLDPLEKLIDEGAATGNSTILQVLGSDGDEFSQVYRAPPRSEVLTRVQTVHLVRTEGRWAVVEDESGATLRVLSAALEPNNASTISLGLPVATQLLRAILAMTTSPEVLEEDEDPLIVIKYPAFFLRSLRLLSEMCDDEHAWNENKSSDDLTHLQSEVVQRLLRILKIQSSDLSSEVILREAWNEICWSNVVQEELRCPIYPSASDFTSDNSPSHGGEALVLYCPTCNEEWHKCAGHHAAPSSVCEQCDLVLRHHNQPSPYVGWFTSWTDTPESLGSIAGSDDEGEANSSDDETAPVKIEFRRVEGDNTAMEGSGQNTYGTFTFSGRQISPTHMKARIVYNHWESSDTVGGSSQAEWNCEACTFANPQDAIRCSICNTVRAGATWKCLICQYAYNAKTATVCATCGHINPLAGRTMSRGRERSCYCKECDEKKEYRTFSSLKLLQRCSQCQEVTEWLPQEKYSGIMEARIVGEGDELEFTWNVDGESFTALGVRCSEYNAAHMKSLVSQLPSGNDLGRYVPVLAAPRRHSADGTYPRKVADSSQTCTPSAIVYYASRLVLLWGPATNPDIFTDASVLTQLRVYDEAWLEHLRALPIDSAAIVLRTCLDVLFSGTSSPHTIQAVSAAARVVMKSNTSLAFQAHYLLYALCLTSTRYPTERTRESCCACIASLFEDFPHEYINAQCLGPLLRQQPVVAGQQRAAIFAMLRQVPCCGSAPSTKATGSLVKAVECMGEGEGLPKLMDTSMAEAFPYVVALAETRINQGGELQVGQVRGSVGFAPTRGGRYYYEIVLPSNYNDTSNMIVMGWGTLQHEHISSSQHVGSDLHSWGFNCRDRLRLMMGEQSIEVPKRPVAGDVIGSMMNLETMMVCWSINGEELMWVSVPAQGESEEIYPYISAAVEPCGVEIRLGNTQFRPTDYKDYSSVSEEQIWGDMSDANPQPYSFYMQLSTLLDTLSVTDLHASSSVQATLTTELGQRQITQFPMVMDFIEAHSDGDGGDAPRWGTACLEPFITHLGAISDLTVMVARNYHLIKDSPYLTACYRKAKDLLSSSARWVLFETQVGGRPTYNVQAPRTVTIDMQKAKTELEEEMSTDEAIHNSVTGQLFAQIENAPVYKNAVMFSVKLTDDVTNDAGGVTRFILSMIADELNYQIRDGARHDPALPLFRLCAHTSMFTVVPNMERFWTERGEASGEDADNSNDLLCSRMLTWLGMLMGNITLCGTMKLTLNFPKLAWKYFTFEDATIQDYYYDVDDTVRGSIADDEFLLNDDYFCSIPGITAARMEGAEDTADQGLPHGLGIRPLRPYSCMTPAMSAVDMVGPMSVAGFDDLEAYTTQEHAKEAKRRRLEAESALLHQYDPALLCIRNGLSAVLSQGALKMFRWDDLQSRICGSAHVSAEHVLEFLDLAGISEEVRDMLVEVLRGFTEEQRAMFLLFCSGQNRLPLPERISVSCGDDPTQLPTAHTCSPISLRLQPYQSSEEMREKFIMCLSNAKQFGFV